MIKKVNHINKTAAPIAEAAVILNLVEGFQEHVQHMELDAHEGLPVLFFQQALPEGQNQIRRQRPLGLHPHQLVKHGYVGVLALFDDAGGGVLLAAAGLGVEFSVEAVDVVDVVDDLAVVGVGSPLIVNGTVVIVGDIVHVMTVPGIQDGDGVALLGVAADHPGFAVTGLDVLAALADRQPVVEIHGAGLALAQGDEMLDGGGAAVVDDAAHAVGAQAVLVGDEGPAHPGLVQAVEVARPDAACLLRGGVLREILPFLAPGQMVDLLLDLRRAGIFMNIQHGISPPASGI